MSILGEPKYSDIPPLELHRIFGMNCYHHACGESRVPVFTDAADPRQYKYMTLCPGESAQKIASLNTTYVERDTFKRIILEGCIEDELIPLEATSPANIAVTLPPESRLIVMKFNSGNGGFNDFDFDFFVHNPSTGKWENKVPLNHVVEYDSVDDNPLSRYKIEQFFIATTAIRSKGIPEGTSVPVRDGYALHFVDKPPAWAHGFSLSDRGSYLCRTNRGQNYAKPAWPQMATAPA